MRLPVRAGQKNETEGKGALVVTTSVVSGGLDSLRRYYFVPRERIPKKAMMTT
jgi:hypothetical protein